MLEEYISQNFTNNINYLQKKHPILFEKLSAYESAIEHGHYKERYELRYENGGFDIYIKESAEFLYKKSPLKYLQATLQTLNTLKNENTFIAFHEKKPWLESDLSQTMKRIGKFIFFGVGSGEHIYEATKKLSASHYFIVEDDLELFRLSLMSTPYYKIATESQLSFAIFEEEKEFKKSASSFLKENYFLNNYIKFLQLPYVDTTKIELFHFAVTTQSHLNFTYKSILKQYTLPIKRIHDAYYFLNILEEEKESILADIPTLLIAPGPSLSKHLQTIQEIQKNFYIVALSATLPLLQKHSIQPDIVIHIDGFERSIAHFKKLENPKEFLKETLGLVSARVPQEVLDIFSQEKLFLFENGTTYKKDFGSFSAFCAGSSSYLLLMALGIKNLYLLGLDLALDAKTLTSHADGYLYTQKAKESKNSLNFRDSLLYTEGNFTPKVPTTPNFLLSIEAIDTITKNLKKSHQKVYNLNNGAKLQGSEPLLLESLLKIPLQKLNKKELQKNIQHSFLQHSQNHFTQEELKQLNSSKKLAKEYKNHIQTFIKEREEHTFFTKLLELASLLTQEAQRETLSLCFEHYFYTVLPHISNILNSTEKNPPLERIYTKLEQELLNITQSYIKDIDGRY